MSEEFLKIMKIYTQSKVDVAGDVFFSVVAAGEIPLFL